MRSLEKILTAYDYPFPKEAIAQEPASPRDHARMLVYDRKKNLVFHDTFLNIDAYIPSHALLVLNKTKVVPARLRLKKESGGIATITYTEMVGTTLQVLSNKKLSIGSRLRLTKTLYFTVVSQKEKYYFLTPSFPHKKLFSVFERYGTMPIPPYIKRCPLSQRQLKEKYQTVFAKKEGSVAAPTASLHITKRIIKKLKEKGIVIAYITLHVGLGTFAPLTKKDIATNTLHHEWYDIDKKTARLISSFLRKKRPIIAVGTTVTRALESAFDVKGRAIQLSGETNLFIHDAYGFKIMKGLITNFHVPQSSLLMLVASFVGRKKLLSLYAQALKQHYRFFSFGDGMLIL